MIDRIDRSARKTLAIHIDSDAKVIVKAPERMSREIIDSFVAGKAAWIEKKKSMMLARPRLTRKYEEGENLPLLGEVFTLRYEDGFGYALRQSGNTVTIARDLKWQAKILIEKWYRKKAHTRLVPMAVEIAGKTGIPVKSVKISSAVRRWGSCSSKGSINLSWRLVMAPVEAAEYVICHELAHRVEMNHSPRFWAAVGKLFPDYKQWREWLKQNGKTLDI